VSAFGLFTLELVKFGKIIGDRLESDASFKRSIRRDGAQGRSRRQCAVGFDEGGAQEVKERIYVFPRGHCSKTCADDTMRRPGIRICHHMEKGMRG
jgi:hypothetical protein